MPRLTRVVALQGLSLRVPQDWNLAALSGERKSGYLRLEDEEMPRLELRWEQPKSVPDLTQVKKRYLRELDKGARRAKSALTVTEGEEFLGKRSRRSRNFLTFGWQSNIEGYTWISYCKRCGRELLGQVYAPLGDDVSQMSSAILETLTDHPSGDWEEWSVFDFNFKVPTDFNLMNQKLLLGLLEMEFERNEETVVFSQWAAGQERLADKSLLDWFNIELKKGKRGLKIRAQETRHREHQAIRILGEKKLLHSLTARAGAWITKRQLATILHWMIWNCGTANRIFSVRTILRPSNSTLAGELVQEVRCH